LLEGNVTMTSVPDFTRLLARIEDWQEGHGKPGGRAETARRALARAAAWRERALQLAEGDAADDVCVSIAADYESLARTLEERERPPRDARKPVPHLGPPDWGGGGLRRGKQ
jgi:hypothetical protein